MGSFAIKPIVQMLAWLITGVLVYLNLNMVLGEAQDYFRTSDNLFWKIVIVIAGILFISLFLVALLYPIFRRKWKPMQVQLHPEATALHSISIPAYTKIAVALDFSENDQKLLSHALGQGNNNSSFVLIHVVESVPARLYENESDDLETEKDKEHLVFYAHQLQERGFNAEARIGFGQRAKEIVKMVKESGADMLVIGAHGHGAFKDLIYGETINTVRHDLKIPVLVVSL